MRMGDTHIHISARVAAAGAVGLLVLALATGCDGSDAGDQSRDDATVAVVGDEAIRESQLDAQVDSLLRAQSPEASKPGRDQLERQALAVLLQREWLEREARRRSIEPDDDAVRERWQETVRDQFQTDEDLQRFLGRQTETDALAQLRLQMLSEAIEADVRQAASGNSDRALARYRRRFVRESQSVTSCRKGIQAPGCGD